MYYINCVSSCNVLTSLFLKLFFVFRKAYILFHWLPLNLYLLCSLLGINEKNSLNFSYLVFSFKGICWFSPVTYSAINDHAPLFPPSLLFLSVVTFVVFFLLCQNTFCLLLFLHPYLCLLSGSYILAEVIQYYLTVSCNKDAYCKP